MSGLPIFRHAQRALVHPTQTLQNMARKSTLPITTAVVFGSYPRNEPNAEMFVSAPGQSPMIALISASYDLA
jgi:hypothetical protein